MTDNDVALAHLIRSDDPICGGKTGKTLVMITVAALIIGHDGIRIDP